MNSFGKNKIIFKGIWAVLAVLLSAYSLHAAETIELDSTYRVTSADEGNSFVFNNVSVESSDASLYGFYMLGTKVKNTTVDSVSGSLNLKTTGSGTQRTSSIYGVYIRTGNNTINTLSGNYEFVCDTSSTSNYGGSVYGVVVANGSLYNVENITLGVSTNSKKGDAYGFNFASGAYGVSNGSEDVGVKFSNADISVSGNSKVTGILGAERVASFQGNLVVSGVEGGSVNALKFDNTSGINKKIFKLSGESSISAVNGNSIYSAVNGNLNIIGDVGGNQVFDGNISIAGYSNTTTSISFTNGNFAVQNSSSGEVLLNGVRDPANAKETLYDFSGGSVVFNDDAIFSSTLVEIGGGVLLSTADGKGLSFENSIVDIDASQINADRLVLGQGSGLNVTGEASIDVGELSVFEGVAVSLIDEASLSVDSLEVVLSSIQAGTTYDLSDIFGNETLSVLSLVNNNVTMSDTFGHSFDVIVSDNGQITAVPEPSTYAAVFGVLALAFAVYRMRR